MTSFETETKLKEVNLKKRTWYIKIITSMYIIYLEMIYNSFALENKKKFNKQIKI